MAPKFRGNSDDWLDDEAKKSSRQRSQNKQKKPQAKAVGLPPEEANATVAEVFPNQCRVWLDEGEARLLCAYRRAGVVGKSTEDIRERTPVTVGDRVKVSQTGGVTGVIEGICSRLNSLSRPAPGKVETKLYHVLAANIQTVVIVASTDLPAFSPGLIDRFLIAAQMENITPIICITKIDLRDTSSSPAWKVYQDLGYSVFEISSKKGIRIEEFSQEIEGKTVVFCGHSGVGKTSLLRALLKSDIGKVGEVNEVTGKGRHTTTGAVLLGGPKNSRWIDTPGVKEFGLPHVDPDQLAQYFPEFHGLACGQSLCSHLNEEGCLAKSFARYSSYRRILESLLAGEN
jgi:ribosome biogenesis GTPase